MVSIDYRLAPETKLPAIIQDAYRWVRAGVSLLAKTIAREFREDRQGGEDI